MVITKLRRLMNEFLISAVQFAWTDVVLKSNTIVITMQLVFLIVVCVLRIRHHIETRIGGLAAIEIGSWPRLIAAVVLCNSVSLVMYHLYLVFGPARESWFKFAGGQLLIGFLVYCIAAVLGPASLIRVRTSRFKPESSDDSLIDMTLYEGRHAFLIPRGTWFAYQLLMLLSWLAIYGSAFRKPQ